MSVSAHGRGHSEGDIGYCNPAWPSVNLQTFFFTCTSSYKPKRAKKRLYAKVTYFWGKCRFREFIKSKKVKKSVKRIQSCYFLHFSQLFHFFTNAKLVSKKVFAWFTDVQPSCLFPKRANPRAKPAARPSPCSVCVLATIHLASGSLLPFHDFLWKVHSILYHFGRCRLAHAIFGFALLASAVAPPNCTNSVYV